MTSAINGELANQLVKQGTRYAAHEAHGRDDRHPHQHPRGRSSFNHSRGDAKSASLAENPIVADPGETCSLPIDMLRFEAEHDHSRVCERYYELHQLRRSRRRRPKPTRGLQILSVAFHLSCTSNGYFRGSERLQRSAHSSAWRSCTMCAASCTREFMMFSRA